MYVCVESVHLDTVNPYFRDWINSGQDVNDPWFDTDLHPPVHGLYDDSITLRPHLGDEWKTRYYDI